MPLVIIYLPFTPLLLISALRARRLVSRQLPLFALLATLWLASANPVYAQRVQFPSAAPVFNPPSTPASVLPSFDPYGNPLLGTPPADIPYNVTPQFGQPVAPLVQPTPQFGQSVVPQFGGQPVLPPANQFGSPGVPQNGNSIFPSGLPFQWESGSYQYQNSNGQFARLQRFLQQISFEHTWLYSENGADDLSINRTELSATFGIPIFYNPNTPLLLTPGFAFNWFEGPLTLPLDAVGDPPNPDLPPRVYDAYLDGAWHPQLTDWLHADLGLRTGVWTDFKEVSGDSVRILGRGLGVLAFSPQFDILVGAWYLDRNRVKMLPAGGVHWRPNSIWDFYLVFPNPKIRRRSISIGSSQWWIYFAGEYGGGRWTLERANGDPDDVDYNDVRVIYGLEWETQTQARGHIEIAYVFDREIIFDGTATPTLDLDDTFMVRAGVDF